MSKLSGFFARIALFSLAILAVLYTVLLLPGLSGEIGIDDPRTELDPWMVEPPKFPAIIRYQSALEGLTKTPSFGLLVESLDGIPVRVLNLNAIDSSLGEGFLQFVTAGGFELAEEVHSHMEKSEYAHFIEQLPGDDLARIILPPVDLSHRQLQEGQRIIVGVGFNYAAHREETKSAHIERFAFAKMVVPTGAYVPLGLDTPLPQLPEAPVLGDYEVELGFVTMEDIDLSPPPTDRVALLERIAFFNANDVSDRWPIIVEGDSGFTRGKSRPGYLPLGPWVIHGRQLDPATESGGETPLRLSLSVKEGGSAEKTSGRQNSNTVRMIRGPLEILGMLGEIAAVSRRSDWNGVERGIVAERDGRMLLPAGSIVLTGTPVGTAIEAPTAWDNARLIVRGHFSLSRARRLFAEHCVRNRDAMGYLAPGDVVEASIQYLGTQRWQVK